MPLEHLSRNLKKACNQNLINTGNVLMRKRALQRSASAEEEPRPSYGQHDPYDEEYGGDVGSEDEDEEWGDLEEAEVGLDKMHNDWQERMERKKGKNKG